MTPSLIDNGDGTYNIVDTDRITVVWTSNGQQTGYISMFNGSLSDAQAVLAVKNSDQAVFQSVVDTINGYLATNPTADQIQSQIDALNTKLATLKTNTLTPPKTI